MLYIGRDLLLEIKFRELLQYFGFELRLLEGKPELLGGRLNFLRKNYNSVISLAPICCTNFLFVEDDIRVKLLMEGRIQSEVKVFQIINSLCTKFNLILIFDASVPRHIL
jgi:hypothetical protein